MTAYRTAAFPTADTAFPDDRDKVVLLAVDLGEEVRYVQFVTREQASAAGRLLREVGFDRSVRVLVQGEAVTWA